MEAKARTVDVRLLALLVAIVAVGVTIWAAGALAAGGSSGSSDSPSSGIPAWPIQTQDDGGAQAPNDDCPDRPGGGSRGSGAGDGSSSGSSQL